MSVEACFCDLSIFDVANCLLEKTKVSLPVIITAYAVGYIWSARKRMHDMKNHCEILEKDMKIMKKENYYLVDEIRRLKCGSDTMICKSRSNRCRDKPKSYSCSPQDNFDLSLKVPPSDFDKTCPDRSISRKIKLKKSSRNSHGADQVNFNETLAISLPDVSYSCDLPCSDFKKLDTYKVEWLPNAESTRLFDYTGNDIDNCKNRRSKKVNCSLTGSSDKSFKLKNSCNKSISLNCKRLKSRAFSPNECPHSLQSEEIKCKKLELNKKRTCSSPENSFCSVCPSVASFITTKKCLSNDKAKSNRKCDTSNYPNLLKSTKRIKEKIEKCKMEITRDLNTIPDVFKYLKPKEPKNCSRVFYEPQKKSCVNNKCKRPRKICK